MLENSDWAKEAYDIGLHKTIERVKAAYESKFKKHIALLSDIRDGLTVTEAAERNHSDRQKVYKLMKFYEVNALIPAERHSRILAAKMYNKSGRKRALIRLSKCDCQTCYWIRSRIKKFGYGADPSLK